MTAAPLPTPAPAERVLRFGVDSVAELRHLLDRPDAVLLAGADEPGGDGPCRLGIAGPTAKNLALARRVVAKGTPWRGRNDVWFSPRPLLAEAGAGIAFLFPGLEGEFSPRVDDVAAALGVPSPAVDTSSIATHAASALRVGQLLDLALRDLGIVPDLVAGHSVGEWNAMAAGEMFSTADLEAMVGRCDLDSMAVPDVDFGVAGCPTTRLAPLLDRTPEVVISHENSPHQSVVCGPPAAVAAVLDTLRADGVVCQVLPFRSGFHTPMLAPHLSFFEPGLAALPLRPPTVPVWSATAAAPFPADAEAVRALCVRHLLEPVRFRATVEGMHDAGARVFIQVGAGQLGSLVSDTLRSREHVAVVANSAHRSGIDQLRRVATAVWVEGGRCRFPDPPVPDASAVAPATPAVPSPAERELAALLVDVDDLAALARLVFAERDAPAVPARTPAPADVLHVSTAAMPYLIDHCFVPQRAGWPDVADRRPVVPATTVIEHLLDAARARTGGSVPLGLDDLRLHRWLVAEPAVDVPVEIGPAGPGRLHVALGTYAEADVVFDQSRSATPAPWAREAGELAPRRSARDLYEQRWLFHGDRFQVVDRTVAVGPTTMRADLRVTAVPGALLDGVGHVLGSWLVERHEAAWLAFPVRLDRLRRHAPLPPVGSVVQCTVRVEHLDDEVIVAAAQLVHDGRVVVSLDGWRDRRFDCTPHDNVVYRSPESSTLATRRPDGGWEVHDRWRDLASRELWLHRYLTGAEVAAHQALPPRDRREWLLSRIAVKDAVRARLWEAGAGPVYPAEVTVHGPAHGHCTVTGTHGLAVPDLTVTVSHTDDRAVVHLGPAPRPSTTDLSVAKELIP